jgi:hypothetical protein
VRALTGLSQQYSSQLPVRAPIRTHILTLRGWLRPHSNLHEYPGLTDHSHYYFSPQRISSTASLTHCTLQLRSATDEDLRVVTLNARGLQGTCKWYDMQALAAECGCPDMISLTETKHKRKAAPNGCMKSYILRTAQRWSRWGHTTRREEVLLGKPTATAGCASGM